MKRRVVAMLLSVGILVCFTACTKQMVPDTSSGGVVGTAQPSTPDAASTTATTTTTVPGSTSAKRTATTTKRAVATRPQGGVSSKGHQVSDENHTLVEEIRVPDGGTVAPPKKPAPAITQTVQANTAHKALAASAYYQYARLSATEKAAYDRIVSAIKTTNNLVDVTSYAFTQEQATALLDKVFADNPQFFWVSKFVSLTHTTQGEVLQVVLYYTDGSAVDHMDENHTIVPSANRQTIAKQIAAFNTSVASVLAGISPALSPLEKEKAIHDYITETVGYDHTVAEDSLGHGDIYSRAYDVYGALCGKAAMCEGYAKLFQYLCYCVGINATQVVGTGHGGPHMWNAVQIGGAWYHVDVTWDDVEMKGVKYYLYFNRSDSAFADTHTVQSQTVAVPACTGTAHTPEKTFCMTLAGRQSAPGNYQTALDHLNKNGDTYLLLYVGEETGLAAYLQTYVCGPQAPVMQYIQSKGYRLAFGTDRFACGGYVYLEIIRT